MINSASNNVPLSGSPTQMISSLADVESIEPQLFASLPANTYDVIAATAHRTPASPALSFFLTVDDHKRPEVWSYRRLFKGITATANFLHSLGLGKDDVVGYVLPNLPETHLTLWGGQAAGIVFAVNPLLEAPAIGDLLRSADAKVLVTLAPSPGTPVRLRYDVKFYSDPVRTIPRGAQGVVARPPRCVDPATGLCWVSFPGLAVWCYERELEPIPRDSACSP